jgi:deoxycytidylate deaminase
MAEARTEALMRSLDAAVKTGAVVVLKGRIVGRGANGSSYHETHECERVRRGIPTGEGYDLCEGCHPKNHAERRAVEEAGALADGADLYLWGHWWACEPCWNAMIDAGIRDVYVVEGSEHLFNKQDPGNILGRWEHHYENTH